MRRGRLRPLQWGRTTPSTTTIARALFLLLLACSPAASHRLDELLQATHVSLFLDHVALQLYLTPGSALAHSIHSQIDSDGDGTVSPTEAQSFEQDFLQNYTLQVDEVQQALQVISGQFPSEAELLTGEGTIRMKLSTPVIVQRPGPHRIVLKNNNAAATSIYLVNVMLPEDTRIAIGKQERDAPQRIYSLDYEVMPKSNRSRGFVGGWPTLLEAVALAGLIFVAISVRNRRTLAGPESIADGDRK